MLRNISTRQFFKDGLVGLIVIFAIYAVLLIIAFGIELYPFTYESFWALIRISFTFPRTSLSIANGVPNWHVFNSPMPLVILTTFLALGSSGRSLENVPSRAYWIKPIIIVVTRSWLASIVLWPVFLVMIVRLWIGSNDAIDQSASIPLLFGAIGGILGLLIGYGLGLIFNPVSRFFRIMIGAIASICVTYAVGAGILLEQWLH